MRFLQNKLVKNENLFNQYNDLAKDQIEKRIIKKVDPKVKNNLVHYLPRQLVVTPNKTTTKLRVVYDASAHTSTGVSLNKVLFGGPVMLPDLCWILLRWRRENFALIADIEKAFLQIKINEKESHVSYG